MATGSADGEDFKFPPEHGFPPFYTLQPNALTKRAQLQQWSTIIQGYCRHHHLFMLSLADALETPLFRNKDLGKRLGMADTKEVLDWMSSKEGGERVEWMGTAHETCWVYWRRPEEWASVLAEWVEETGQKNTVLTLYELTQGENTKRQDFHNMDPEILQKSLNILVKRGKAQIFGSEDQQGVKFF